MYVKKARPLPIATQNLHLKTAFPKSKVTMNGKNRLVWTGQLQPTPLSAVYTVQIIYKLDDTPEVRVLEPKLVARDGKRLPHVFTGNLLCLFRYKYGEWNSTMSLAATIAPWTSLWLSHYEVWLATGTWCGSKQEHPGENEQRERPTVAGS